MTEASLVPISLTDVDSNVVAGVFTDIDNTIAIPSGATLDSPINKWTNQTNGTANGNFSFGITNTPGDYDSFTSIKLEVSARVTGGFTDDTVQYRLDISGTNAPSATISFTDVDDGAGLITRNFTDSAVTPSQADINGWVVRVYQWDFGQDKSPDGLNLEIDEIELTLIYTASVGGANPKGPLGMPFHGPFGGPLG